MLHDTSDYVMERKRRMKHDRCALRGEEASEAILPAFTNSERGSKLVVVLEKKASWCHLSV